MNLTRIRASLLCLAVPILPRVGWSQAASPREASIDCGIYVAAIREMGDTNPLLVIDSTADGIPAFAFNAISHPRSLAEQGMPLPDSVLQSLRAANHHRQPLHACLEDLAGIQPISDSTIKLLFPRRDHLGWGHFHERYPRVKRFILVSVPIFLADSLALVYVAYAADWLEGEGALLQLERSANGRWTKKAIAIVWMS